MKKMKNETITILTYIFSEFGEYEGFTAMYESKGLLRKRRHWFGVPVNIGQVHAEVHSN